ncbi:ATP-binding protein [uncultured Oscillibacter sp.]|uniref:ATP-binding protein n=1 Tax=uncultured Oscillibacter sp. TaxID=876091 RepID=UPI0025D8C47A|nr:ATP-binding protein [uncultured Oscillibacter sp.]
MAVVYPQASGKGLQFTEKTAGFSEHTTYVGDSLRLNRILLNPTSNAIKFTPQGGTVSREVTNLPTQDGKCWIRFVVSDTGISMDEDALARLYTQFEQADPSIAQKYGGAGLGMSITQNLASLMGGYIDVRSKPDQGTAFTVELPFEQSNVDLQPLREGVLESLWVLMTDDEQDLCEHMTLLLEKMKIHAEWVLSGTEAVERVGRDLPIIISAYDWSEIEEEARRAGANAFIAKPLFQFSLYNVLVNATNGAFGMSRAKEEPVGTSLRGKRLLLAEDNVLNREIAATLLELNRAAVESAVNGRIAVDRFLQTEPGHFDAILLDVQMPVMDGCEAARQIRACGRPDAKRIPVIATTANAFAEDVSAVPTAGMDARQQAAGHQQLCATLSELCGPDAVPSDGPPPA